MDLLYKCECTRRDIKNALKYQLSETEVKIPKLLIYPGNLWKKISSSFEELSGLNPEIRSLQWNFLGNAHYIDFDISVFNFTINFQLSRTYIFSF